MADAEDPIIGTAEAAEILGWNKRRVQRAADTGAIPVVGKTSSRGDLAFHRSKIEELAKKGATPAP